MTMSETGNEAAEVLNIDLRRAVLGVLLHSPRPLAAAEIETRLRSAGVRTNPRLARSPAKVIADVLAYQHSLGRVRRVRRGVYEIVPGSLGASMRWRCINWKAMRNLRSV